MERDQHSETAGTAPYEVIAPFTILIIRAKRHHTGMLWLPLTLVESGASSTGRLTKYVDVPAAAPAAVSGANTFGTQVLQH